MVKNPPAKAGDIRNGGLILGSGRSPGGGHSNTVQNSCLENSRDGGAWWAAIYGVAQSQTRLKRLSSSSSSKDLLYNTGVSQVALVVKNPPTCQRRRQKRSGFDSWVRKIPWRRAWQATPVLSVKFHGQMRLVGYSPWGCRVRHD